MTIILPINDLREYFVLVPFSKGSVEGNELSVGNRRMPDSSSISDASVGFAPVLVTFPLGTLLPPLALRKARLGLRNAVGNGTKEELRWNAYLKGPIPLI